MRLWAVILLAAIDVALTARDSRSLGELQQKVAQHISQEKFAPAQWGIKVVSLDSGAILFETNAHKLLKPASNAKIFTAALALDVLGPEYRIRTSFLAERPVNGRGAIEGDLIVYGRGDPGFAARFQEGSYSNLFGRIVESLRAAGVKEIIGDLVGDETFFTGPRMGASWTWDDLQYYYGAEVSALTIQDNVADLFFEPGAEIGEPCLLSIKPGGVPLEFVNRTRTTETNVAASIEVHRPIGERRVYITGTLPRNYGTYLDAVTMPEPARWFVQTLHTALIENGIRVRGQVRTRSWPQDSPLDPVDFHEVAFTESPPLREIAAKMIKPSQNLYAQLLFLQVGAPSKNRLTEDSAVRALRAFVKRAGIDPGEVLLDEGSGLSRACLVTPNSIVRLLEFMSKGPHSDSFIAFFPTPGEGTLRNRFRDWRGEAGKKVDLKAKTGSIRYVTALSGYLRSAAGEQLAFSILLNAFDPDSGSARDEVDVIVRALANVAEKSNGSVLEQDTP